MSIQQAVIINYSNFNHVDKSEALTYRHKNYYNNVGIAPAHLDNCTLTDERKRGIMDIASLPLIEYVRKYYARRKFDVRESTYKTRQYLINTAARFSLMSLQVGQIDMDDIYDFLAELVEDNLSRETIKNVYGTVKAPLIDAFNRGKIAVNPCAGVKIPDKTRTGGRHRDTVPYTPKEQEAIRKVAALHKNDAYAAVEVLLETGLRVGELLALTWADIDFARHSAIINKTMVQNASRKNAHVEYFTKTVAGEREIPLSNRALAVLSYLYDKNKDKGYIFGNRNGDCLDYIGLRFHTKNICAAAGVEYKAEHAFRHTCASNMRAKGADALLMADILGHANPSFTLDIYAHLFSDNLAEKLKVVQ